MDNWMHITMVLPQFLFSLTPLVILCCMSGYLVIFICCCTCMMVLFIPCKHRFNFLFRKMFCLVLKIMRFNIQILCMYVNFLGIIKLNIRYNEIQAFPKQQCINSNIKISFIGQRNYLHVSSLGFPNVEISNWRRFCWQSRINWKKFPQGIWHLWTKGDASDEQQNWDKCEWVYLGQLSG